MLIVPQISIEDFQFDQIDIADKLLEQIKDKIPGTYYNIIDGQIVFRFPNKKMSLPVKVINGRFYTNNPEFEKYISSDRKSINYTPYSETLENLTLEI